jgi:hypothetical protein
VEMAVAKGGALPETRVFDGGGIIKVVSSIGENDELIIVYASMVVPTETVAAADGEVLAETPLDS